MKDRNTLEKSRQIFNEYLDRKGLRHTAERYMVLEVVSTITESFSVDMLCRRMEDTNCLVPAGLSANFRKADASVFTSIPQFHESTASAVIAVKSAN